MNVQYSFAKLIFKGTRRPAHPGLTRIRGIRHSGSGY